MKEANNNKIKLNFPPRINIEPHAYTEIVFTCLGFKLLTVYLLLEPKQV